MMTSTFTLHANAESLEQAYSDFYGEKIRKTVVLNSSLPSKENKQRKKLEINI